MKNLLRLEELAQLVLCLFLLIASDVPWWCYLLLALGPDIGMLGYLINSRVGAIAYNLLHHKGFALSAVILGSYLPMVRLFEMTDSDWSNYQIIVLAGVILYGHASMDRIFGYGLKFGDNFHHTHLGWIGRGKAVDAVREAGQGQ